MSDRRPNETRASPTNNAPATLRTAAMETCGAMRRDFRGSRLRRRIWRCFVAMGDAAVPTGLLARYCWPRHNRFRPGQYERVRRAALELGAVVVGHERRGRNSTVPGGLLWRLREPI
jgi:hypothetical protein